MISYSHIFYRDHATASYDTRTGDLAAITSSHTAHFRLRQVNLFSDTGR
jgi:hypothetical protein